MAIIRFKTKHGVVEFKGKGKKKSQSKKTAKNHIAKSGMPPALKKRARAVVSGQVGRDSKGRFI